MTISVITVAFNEEAHLEEAIESVLTQDCTDIEYLIADDGSDDATLEIARRAAANDQRIKVFSYPHRGKVAALNAICSHARGDWITLLAGDDVLESGILKQWISIASGISNPDKVAIISRLRMFSDEIEYRKYDGVEVPKDPDKVCESGCCFFITRNALQEFLPIPSELPNEDGWISLYFKYILSKKIAYPVVSLNYRIHGGNSMKKDESFLKFTEGMHAREQVVPLFLERYQNLLTSEGKTQLRLRYRLEQLRYSGEWLGILFLKGVSLKDKMRAFLTSNPRLYSIKIHLNTVLYGR